MEGRVTIGTAWILDRGKVAGKGRERTLDEAITIEKQRVKAAIENSPVPGLFSAHLEMLEDPLLLDTINRNIDEGMTPASAVKAAGEEIAGMFSGIDDEYLKARADDARDICRCLENSLLGVTGNLFENLTEEAVVVAEELFPSDTARMDLDKIKAFVTAKGSPTSHVRVIARSRGIAAVSGTDISGIHQGDRLLVLEDEAKVIVNPDGETIKTFFPRMVDGNIFPEEARRRVRESGVKIYGNAGSVKDVKAAIKSGADGIGLFRTEFVFMGKEIPPTGEEQYRIYREAVEACEGKPLTIRTLDAGGDKPVPCLGLAREDNPFLGMRGIRLSLARKDLFKDQIRAILRASAHGEIRLMFPMVARVAEIIEARAIVSEVTASLEAEGIPFDMNMKIGIMIETPAAVLTADLMASESDFFSVGTNDLSQYIMAAGRDNSSVSYLLNPLDDAMVRALRMVVEAARGKGIPVGVCGEAAADPEVATVLCDLGFDSLSVGSPSLIKELKGND